MLLISVSFFPTRITLESSKSINIKMSQIYNQQTTLEIKMPRALERYNVSIKRISKGANKYETTAKAGPFSMVLKDEINLYDTPSPKVDILITSNFVEKVLVTYTHDIQEFKFSIKNGQDHLCVDMDYKYSEPTFEANVEVRSNKIPGEKINLKTNYNGQHFTFSMDYTTGRALDINVTVPGSFKGKSGVIEMNVKTSDPLPALESRINVDYKFDNGGKSASLSGIVNGRKIDVNLTQEKDGSSYVTKMKATSPDVDLDYEAILKYNPSGEVDIEFKGGNISLTANANMSGFDINAESNKYKISANVAICIKNCKEQLKCEFRIKDKQAGGEEFIKINAKVKGKEVKITMESSVTGFEKVITSGSIQKTQRGYAFSATGDTGSEGYSIEGEYKATSKEHSLNLRVDYGSKYLKFKTETKIGNEAARADMIIESSEFQRYHATIKGRGKLDSAMEFETRILKGNKSFVEMHIMMENSNVQKGMIATLKTPSGTIMDVQGVLGLEGRRATLKAACVVPSLGMPEDSFKANFAFQPFENSSNAMKFEVLGDLVLMGHQRKIVLKLNSDKAFNNEIEVGFKAFGHNYSMKMGSEAGSANPRTNTFRIYLNDSEAVIQRLKDDDYTAKEQTMRIRISGKIDLNMIGAGNADLGVTEVTAKLASTKWLFKDWKIEISGKSNSFFVGTFGAKIALNDNPYDRPGLQISASGEVDTDTIKKKVAILADTGDKGAIEVSYGNGVNHKVVVALSRSKRSARASFYNDDFGNFDFELGEELTSGVLILTTRYGH